MRLRYLLLYLGFTPPFCRYIAASTSAAAIPTSPSGTALFASSSASASSCRVLSLQTRRIRGGVGYGFSDSLCDASNYSILLALYLAPFTQYQLRVLKCAQQCGQISDDSQWKIGASNRCPSDVMTDWPQTWQRRLFWGWQLSRLHWKQAAG